MKPWISGLLLMILVLGGASSAMARTWTDLAGRTVEGVFQDYDARTRTVSISLESGKSQEVRLDLLSRTDQQYVRDLLKQRGFADPGEAPPAPGSRLPGNPDQSAASNNGAQLDSGAMSQDQGDTVGSVNAPPIPLSPFNRGVNRGPASPFQGSAMGGRDAYRQGSQTPAGYSGVPRPGAGPSSNLPNGPMGGYDPERYMADDASGISNRENGPTSNLYNAPFGGATGAGPGGEFGGSNAAIGRTSGGRPSGGRPGLGPPSPFGPDGRLPGMGPPSPLDGGNSSPFGSSDTLASGPPSTPQPAAGPEASEPFGSSVGPAGSLIASRPPSSTPSRGPSNNPADVGLNDEDIFSSPQSSGAVSGATSFTGEKLDSETEMILGGMALVGGLICGALGMLVFVGLVVLVIAMSRSRKTQTRVRYS
jgi:hypothetical protein